MFQLTHAQRLAARIRELQGTVPGSMQFRAIQETMQPPADSTDVVTVIRGTVGFVTSGAPTLLRGLVVVV